MLVDYKPLKPSDIEELQEDTTLYTLDFRATGENLSEEIPEMWKYENLLPWILKEKYCLVNELSKEIIYPHKNKTIIIRRSSEPHESILSRAQNSKIDKNITKLWVGVPHLDSDSFAKNKKIKVNYTYMLFEKLNDKLLQKKHFKNCSPEYKPINSEEELREILRENNSYFLKRRTGAGGYTIFNMEENEINKIMKNSLIKDGLSKNQFYLEKKIEGIPHSVQVYKKNNHFTIFGFAEQLFNKPHFFKGCILLPLADIRCKQFLELILKQALVFLEDYNGFFGIDFMIDNNVFQLLELNVRTTAATIPTLLLNEQEWKSAIYLENQEISNITGEDIVLSVFKDKRDILRRRE